MNSNANALTMRDAILSAETNRRFVAATPTRSAPKGAFAIATDGYVSVHP